MIELEKSVCYPTVVISSGKAHQKMLKSLGEMLFRNRLLSERHPIDYLLITKGVWGVYIYIREIWQSPPDPRGKQRHQTALSSADAML